MFFVAVLFACQQQEEPSSISDSTAGTLVTVNGQVISEGDLDVMTEKMFARNNQVFQSQDVREKALESMIMMSLIAQEGEKSISRNMLDEVNAKSRFYREELLAEQYIREHVDVLPPSEAQIQAYYDSNRALFEKKAVHYFDFISTRFKPEPNALKDYTDELSGLKNGAWYEEIEHLKRQTEVYEVISTHTTQPGLHKSMLQAVGQLAEGETSSVVMINNKPYVFYLAKVQAGKQVPLLQVKDRIRKILAAQTLKAHVKQISEKLMEQSSIIYAN